MKRAVITGASSGIGKAFAERLARDGYDVVLVARRRERLESLATVLRDTYGRRVDVLSADLTSPSDLTLVEQNIRDDSSLELLVNNAGFGKIGAYGDLDLDVEDEEIRLNILALVRLTHAAIPGMVARHRGAIINVSSIVAFLPVPFLATYSATKAYVNSFTEAIHEELKGTGVKIQALCPGRTHTEFHERAGINTKNHPSKGMEPESVVNASLRALQRDKVICVPGITNRVTACIMSLLPRALLRKAAAPRMRKLTAKIARP
ncbi:MAG TPA: SDR family oxidoreductase [Nitrospirales bacterium]|nr:SDR family oxidoreductase [Nitrospirales bacterium]HIN32616.1 SDR family oxidoreductase [Nitrospirales bacterium]